MQPKPGEDLFLALSHPARRAVLEELRQGERPAMQLAVGHGLTPSALSQHLRALKDAGLVRERREGRQRIYSLLPGRLREVATWAKAFEQYWPNKLDALGAHLRSRK